MKPGGFGRPLATLTTLLVLAGAGWAVTNVPNGSPPPPPPPSGNANVWINTTAGNCLRSSTAIAFNSVTACGDLASAYSVAAPGDTVRMRAGHYPSQEFEYNTNNGKGNGTAVVTFLTDNGTVWFDGTLHLGDDSNVDSRVTGTKFTAPTDVTFDGGTNKDFRIGDSTHQASLVVVLGNHETFTNWIIGHVMHDNGGAMIYTYSTYHLTVSNSIIGPGCCGLNNTPWDWYDPLKDTGHNNWSGLIGSSHLTIDHDTFYGNARNTQMWNIQYNSGSSLLQYGAPPGTSCTDGTACHGDCLHMWSADSLTISNSLFDFCDVQGWFLELQGCQPSGCPSNEGGSLEGTNNILNNYWVMMDEGVGAGPDCVTNCGNWGGRGSLMILGSTAGTPNVGCNCGTVNIMGNTLAYDADSNFGSANGATPAWGNETINYKANLGGRIVNDTPWTGCASAPSLTINYDYNIFATTSSGHSDCGTHVANYDYNTTIAGWINPLTGLLLSGASAPNGYVNDAAVCAALGRATPCAAGVVGPIGAS